MVNDVHVRLNHSTTSSDRLRCPQYVRRTFLHMEPKPVTLSPIDSVIQYAAS
jgi:hypothetical protein